MVTVRDQIAYKKRLTEIDPEKAKKLKKIVMPPIFNRDVSNTDLSSHPKIKNKSAFSRHYEQKIPARAKYIRDNFGYYGDPEELAQSNSQPRLDIFKLEQK
jgi:hypothetical protein